MHASSSVKKVEQITSTEAIHRLSLNFTWRKVLAVTKSSLHFPKNAPTGARKSLFGNNLWF
jgi:hypothetical protein